MNFEDLQYLEKCQQCGCVFDILMAMIDDKNTKCPACGQEYELPRSNKHT